MADDRRRRERHAHRHLPHPHIYRPFRHHDDEDGFTARLAARIADGIGTPAFIVIATVVILLWIAVNALAVSLRWDEYPFILLNLAFSAQAFYACSLTVLAFKVQARRQKAADQAAAEHRQEEANRAQEELRANTAMVSQVERLTQSQNATLEALRTQGTQIAKLTTELHETVCQKKKPSRSSSARSRAASPRSKRGSSGSGKPSS